MAAQTATQLAVMNEPRATQKLFADLWESRLPNGSKPTHRQSVAVALEMLANTLKGDLNPRGVLPSYLAVLEDLNRQQCIRAFGRALETCKFFPAPTELRQLAGCAEEPDEALAVLTRIVALMRRFGPRLEPIPGAVLETEDADGRVLVRPRVAIPEAPPALGAVAETALVELGLEDRREGLALIAAHPALSGNLGQNGEPQPAMFRLKAQQEIERRWCAAYAWAKAGQPLSNGWE